MLVKELNFTRAAERLFISQQCLSSYIKRMEEYFNLQLFERKPSLKLTFAGELLYKAILEVDAIDKRLNAELSDLTSDCRGKISIGISSNRSLVYIPEFIAAYQPKYPNIELKITESNVSKLEENLIKNEIDFLIGSEVPSSEPELNYCKTIDLLKEKVYIVVTDYLLKEHFPNFPACKDKIKQGADLLLFRDFPMIMNPEANILHTWIMRYFADKRVKPKISIETGNVDIALVLSTNNAGIMFCPQMCLAHRLKNSPSLIKDINYYPIRDYFQEHKIVLKYHKDKVVPKYLSDAFTITKTIFNNYTIE
jgi:DNA-binding transcriptional LysR family regulator